MLVMRRLVDCVVNKTFKLTVHELSGDMPPVDTNDMQR